MLRYVTPTILIAIAITVFFTFVNPKYNKVFRADAVVVEGGDTSLKTQQDAYNKALDQSKDLENQRDILVKKYNDISQTNKDKLRRLLPDNVDNIRLIIEIENVAFPYGMVLKDVRYDALNSKDKPKTEVLAGGSEASQNSKDYGIWNLEFSTEGTYNNFLNFVKDLESNLRIVDIISVQFSSDTDLPTPKSGASSSPIYKYTFKIQTYWLKN